MSETGKKSQLQIRVSAAEKAAIQRDARLAGMDMSTYVLSRVLAQPAGRFRALVAACASSAEPGYALADLNAFLTRLAPGSVRDAVRAAPDARMPPFVANYVAAMVEQTCAQRGIPCPEWLRQIEPLPEPAFGSQLQSLRLYLLTHSPPPFRRRNIFIDAGVGAQV